METTASQRLKLLRKQLGLNQSEFALQIGVTPQSISAIERGGGLSSSSASAISKTFQVSSDWLLTGKGQMFLDKNRPAAPLTLVDHWKEEAYEALKSQVETLKEDNSKLWSLVERLVGPGAAAALSKLEAALTGDSSKVVAMQIPIAA